MKAPRLCMIACLACAMLGCGQKGPLLLPDTPKHKRTAPKPPHVRAPAPPDGAAASPAPADTGTTPSPGPAGPPPNQTTPPQP